MQTKMTQITQMIQQSEHEKNNPNVKWEKEDVSELIQGIINNENFEFASEGEKWADVTYELIQDLIANGATSDNFRVKVILPESEPLRIGQSYYVPDLDIEGVKKCQWYDNKNDLEFLKLGLIFLEYRGAHQKCKEIKRLLMK